MFWYIHIKPVAICTTGFSHQDGIVTFSFQSISYSPPVKPLSSNMLTAIFCWTLCVCTGLTYLLVLYLHTKHHFQYLSIHSQKMPLAGYIPENGMHCHVYSNCYVYFCHTHFDMMNVLHSFILDHAANWTQAFSSTSSLTKCCYGPATNTQLSITLLLLYILQQAVGMFTGRTLTTTQLFLDAGVQLGGGAW